MEKNLKIIVIIGIVVILVFVFLIVDLMLENKNTPTNNPMGNVQDETFSTEDYVISNGVNLYSDTNAGTGAENTRMFVTVQSINAQNDEVISVSVQDEYNVYELAVGDMKLIDLSYNGVDELSLVYKTGGAARAVVGYPVYLYKTQSGWSMDERVHYGGQIEKSTGTVVDFEFAPMLYQNGHIEISYIILQSADGQEIKLPINAMSVQTIMSAGQMTVYYAGDGEHNHIYNVKTSDDFSANITMHDGSAAIIAKGSQMNVQKSSSRDYWEPQEHIDYTRYKGSITDVIFSHDDKGVTGIDYLVITLENGTQELMPMLYTQAMYGKPFGNYERTYSYDGTDMAVSNIEPADDWRVDLYYENNSVLNLRVSSSVWVSKNDDDVFVLDYEYTYSVQESENE